MKREYIMINQALERALVYVIEVQSEQIEKDILLLTDRTFENRHFLALIGAACPSVYRSPHVKVAHFSTRAEMDTHLHDSLHDLPVNFFYRFCGRVLCIGDDMWFLRGNDLGVRYMQFFHVGNETTNTVDGSFIEKVISTNIGYLINFSNRILCPLEGPVSESILTNIGEKGPTISRECCVLFQDIPLDEMMEFSTRVYQAGYDKSWFFYFSEKRKNIFQVRFEDSAMNIKHVSRVGVKI